MKHDIVQILEDEDILVRAQKTRRKFMQGSKKCVKGRIVSQQSSNMGSKMRNEKLAELGERLQEGEEQKEALERQFCDAHKTIGQPVQARQCQFNSDLPES